MPHARTILRLVGLAVAGVVLTAAAYELPPRIEFDTVPHPADIVGVYRMEPTHPGNQTDRQHFLRLSADGSVHHEMLVLADSGGRLVSEMRMEARADTRWRIEWPADGGVRVTWFERPRLCMGRGGQEICTPFERNAFTGDLTLREEPVLARGASDRLVRLRANGIYF
jgi:hypothetical protein